MIGFIGLGIMGSRMANNLLNNGHTLCVYNRTRAKAEPLLQKGARWCESPAEVGRTAQIIITMLSTPDVVRETALGEDGFLYQMAEGSLWIDCSTVNPSFSQSMAGKAEKKNVRFMDAPVAGSKIPAEKGELIFLAGGSAVDLEESKPLLEIMGKKVLHIGDHGKGTAMKMVINLMLAQSMLAFSEALSLGESLGIPQETLFDTLLGGPTAAPFLALKRDKIESGDYDAEFPLQWMHKDLQLVSETAFENEVALPSIHTAKEVYALAKQYGFADKDFSAIYAFLKQGRGR